MQGFPKPINLHFRTSPARKPCSELTGERVASCPRSQSRAPAGGGAGLRFILCCVEAWVAAWDAADSEVLMEHVMCQILMEMLRLQLWAH